MPILNYTTTISTHKTVGEIMEILSKAGAVSISIDYAADHTPIAVYFEVNHNEKRLAYHLPSNWIGVERKLAEQNVARKYQGEEQARRVAWRIIKDWIEAQIAIIEAGQAVLAEVFLPYMIDPNTNLTVFQQFNTGYLLGGPSDRSNGS